MIVAAVGLFAAVSCTPDPGPAVPTSPISGRLVGGTVSHYQETYFSPRICAPVGTTVRVTGSAHADNAAVKLMTDSDQTTANLTAIPAAGGDVLLTTTEPCWTVFVALFNLTWIDGSTLDFTITWPAP